MPRHVALLRGVNVGGKNKVAMSELRELFESRGFDQPQSYIQSGNIVFTSKKKVGAGSLEAAIADRFGIEPTVVLRTHDEMEQVVKDNPFPEAGTSELHVGFMARQPGKQAVAGLDGEPFAPDRFVVRGREIYLHLPNGMGRSKLPPYLDRRLKVPTTYRNWKTVAKLIELSNG